MENSCVNAPSMSHRLQKPPHIATAGLAHVAVATFSISADVAVNGAESIGAPLDSSWTGTDVSVCVPTRPAPVERSSIDRLVSASVHTKYAALLPLNLMTTPADVAAQGTQPAATHHLSSTTISAGVFAHEGCTVQLGKHSAIRLVAVFALQGDIAIHLRNLMQIPVSANALPSHSVQAPSVSIPTPASVSVQTVPTNVPPLPKFSTHARANASAQK